MSQLRFDGRVAIVTGAGNGLGRAHALLLASRGARVVVNDLGGTSTGGGKSSEAADRVVSEIKEKGGEAVANYDSVEDGSQIAQCALDTWGQCDILINNAGILRDTSFHKMTQDDWDLVYRVHVLGAFRLTQALWNPMRDRGYGRILFTASAAGIYGNFGQANYSMAKLGLLGFSNTLAVEGKKKGVQVNTIAPIAGSRLTETILPKEVTEALKPEYVSSLAAWLCHESCTDTGGLYEVGGGFFAKLRWERTEGKIFKLGRDISPEDVQTAWAPITDFSKSSHPSDVTQSMQPILGNLGTKSRGGNALIDADAAWGYEFPTVTSSYDERDVALYALGVGAAKNALDPSELQYVYEMHGEGMKPLPTFAVVPALKIVFDMYKENKAAPGLNYGFDRVLHGEQYVEMKRPLPSHAKLTHKVKIKDIFDKGKNALVVTEIVSRDEQGNVLFTNEMTAFVRGAGGWGGDRGPSADVNPAPERAPDATVSEKIDENQAILYRLSGDINPLHIDPAFAKNFGFDKPILHGLCSFGYAARHVLKTYAKGDPRFFKSIKVRFSDTVFPGETLVTEMWKESDQRIVFRCKIKERDKVVISNAAVELFKEIPKEVAARPAAAATAPGAAGPSPADSGEATSREGFAVIADYIASNPDLGAQVGKSYVFKLTNPDSAWTIDLKSAKPSVTEGESPADCILEFADSDFRDMMMGKADAQKMYFAGKLKIGGDLMASQKLFFLKKIDQKRAVEVITKLRGGHSSAAPAASATANDGPPTSREGFLVIKDYIESHADLPGQVGKTYVFKLTGPESAWTIDLKDGKGSVTEGESAADCTLELADADFRDMMMGKADAQQMYFGGKLKIAGDLMASQKLFFLKKIDQKRAVEVVTKLRKGSASPAAAAPAKAEAAAPKREATAPNVMAALKERLAKTPALGKEVGAVVWLRVTGPEASYTLDFVKGEVREGEPAARDATLTLKDEVLATLSKEGDFRALYQQGKIRVDGDMKVAHRLGGLKGVL